MGANCFYFFAQWAPASPVNLPVNGGITIKTRQIERNTHFLEVPNRGFAQAEMSPPELASQLISHTQKTGRIAYASAGHIPTQAIAHSVSSAQPDTTAQTAQRHSALIIFINLTRDRRRACCAHHCQADSECTTIVNQISSWRCALPVCLGRKTNPCHPNAWNAASADASTQTKYRARWIVTRATSRVGINSSLHSRKTSPSDSAGMHSLVSGSYCGIPASSGCLDRGGPRG